MTESLAADVSDARPADRPGLVDKPDAWSEIWH